MSEARDILGKKLHKDDDVYLLSCGTGGSLYKAECTVVNFEDDMVVVKEKEVENALITVSPGNLIRC